MFSEIYHHREKCRRGDPAVSTRKKFKAGVIIVMSGTELKVSLPPRKCHGGSSTDVNRGNSRTVIAQALPSIQ